MKNACIYGLIVIAIIITGCSGSTVYGSGDIVNQDRFFYDYDKISASNAISITITQGTEYGLHIEADDNIIDNYFSATKENDTLHLHLDQMYSYTNVTIRAFIQLPSLTELEMDDAVAGSISGFSGNRNLRIDLDDACSLSGSITCGTGKLTVDLSDASHLSLSGNCATMEIDAEDASVFDLSEYPTPDGDYTLTGASSGKVSCSTTITYQLSGASVLTNDQNPALVGSPSVADASEYKQGS